MLASMQQTATDAISSSKWVWGLLVAVCAPHGLCYNMHLRRQARRLIPFLDPFVTIDINSNESSRFASGEESDSDDAFKEVEAYLSKKCTQDALAFRSNGTTVEGRSFLLRLREGEEVTDRFQGVTVWWRLEESSGSLERKRCLRLMFLQRHQALMLDKYLPHVRQTGRKDLFVTMDIVTIISMSPIHDAEKSGESSHNAYKEVEAYLTKLGSPDALAFCAEGSVEDRSGFLLRLREGQEVTDRFGDATVCWLLKKSCFRLMCLQQHRTKILEEYLPHVRQIGRQDLLVTIDITDSDNDEAYKEVEAYLTKVCTRDALAFRVDGTTVEGRSFLLRLREGEEVTDLFQGVTVRWSTGTSKKRNADSEGTTSFFRLMFPQRLRTKILEEYLPHVHQIGRGDLFVTIDITDSDEAFKQVKAYLNSACSRDTLHLRAEGAVKSDSFLFSLEGVGEVADSFSGVTVRWLSLSSIRPCCFRLMFPQQQRALIMKEYLPHVRRQGRNIMNVKRDLRHYTNNESQSWRVTGSWSHIYFDHPSTFDTLAMDPKEKRKIIEDLDMFRTNKDYYRRIGKPWKRGYLLYGPPGTGKSSLIAAMANYLNYDVYDIELTSVMKNSNLRSLLVEITGKSIIVIEDIDCCGFDDVTDQRNNRGLRYNHNDDKEKSKLTLSGLLNFIDGVWSAQSGERIIVLTTNFKEKLDPALIRSGRMDMHIEMSYCCFEAFKLLARNYLGVGEDPPRPEGEGPSNVEDGVVWEQPMFQRVKELLQVVKITPADVAECLLRSQNGLPGSVRGVETSIQRLIDALEKKAAEPKTKRRRQH